MQSLWMVAASLLFACMGVGLILVSGILATAFSRAAPVEQD